MSLTVDQQILIEQRVSNDARSPVVAYLLWFFLGGLGGHRFYLGRTGSAVVLLVLMLGGIATSAFLIGLPLVAIAGCWLLVDAFLIPGMIRADTEALRSRLTKAGITGGPVQ